MAENSEGKTTKCTLRLDTIKPISFAFFFCPRCNKDPMCCGGVLAEASSQVTRDATDPVDNFSGIQHAQGWQVWDWTFFSLYF